ncbi:hypothetical protein J1C52_13795 [Roseibaca sp. Y0-43]|nr:hypothetical protein [Roseibaca sp. Y0-43]
MQLLERSPPLRQRGSPLTGPFNNGKSMITELFAADQQGRGRSRKGSCGRRVPI